MATASRIVGDLGDAPPPPPRLIDPRDGDVEADESSPEHRSLAALAGNMLTEVSLPKLFVAIALLVVVPAVIVGLAPLVGKAWWSTLSQTPRAGTFTAFLLIALLVGVAWYGGRPLFRAVERNFWSLNAMAIQPGYVTWREGMLHLTEKLLGEHASDEKRARWRAVACALAGFIICVLALVVLWFVWPRTRWTGTLADLRAPLRLVSPAIANAAAVALAYLAIAALAWGIADSMMPQPHTLRAFTPHGDFVRSWRVVHLSDLHVVGERYGFRISSGRAGTRGNDRLITILERLDEIHRRHPLDAIVVTGDLTDAGTSPEFAELLDAFDRFPAIASLVVAMPGNHDINVVDRANPARLDLPTSPKKRLRELRTLSALSALHGTRTRVVDGELEIVGDPLDRALDDDAAAMIEFAQHGSRKLAKPVDAAWRSTFPLVWPPATDDGLGILALNSNAETHFSFTNALGLIQHDQAAALAIVMDQYPRAAWIVALHHHIVEHPKLGDALSKRIGTTLVNGNWFTRQLLDDSNHVIVMHGHRHIDWMGQCGGLLIVSAPSAMMHEGPWAPYFYVHTVGVDADGRIGLAEPEKVEIRLGADASGGR